MHRICREFKRLGVQPAAEAGRITSFEILRVVSKAYKQWPGPYTVSTTGG